MTEPRPKRVRRVTSIGTTEEWTGLAWKRVTDRKSEPMTEPAAPTTSFGKMTSERFLKMTRPERIRYGREVAQSYRDEVVLPRGGCGFIWQNQHDGTGSYVCEEAAGHTNEHRTGDVVFQQVPR